MSELVKIPSISTAVVDIDNMVKLIKTYDDGQTVTLHAAAYASHDVVIAAEPTFFKTPHGKRESESYHLSGFIMSGTDVYCVGAPVRRRTAYMVVWDDGEKRWMTWCLGSVNSITQGKRLIDHTLATGVLP